MMYRTLFQTNIKSKTVAFVAGLLLAVGGLVGGATLTVSRVSAAGDCDNNAIIHCGFSSASGFISDVRNNSDDVGHHDLQSVYAHQFVSGQFLSSSIYGDFASHAVAGTAYKDGRIVVNGQTVATGTSSIGRLESFQGSNPKSYVVGSTTYWGNVNSQSFASDSLPVYVLFNDQGTMQFAVLKSCGNPVFGPPVKTSASCNSLQKTAVAGQLNTYDFTASTNVQGNARIVKYVYNFGDGTTQTVTSNFGQAVRHTYTKAGTFTATVTQFVSVPGNDNLQLPVISMCTKTVTVTLPFYSCTSLTGAILDQSKFEYSFTATASYGNGATFTGADFTFGDGKSQTGVKPSTSKTVTVTHTYAQAGNYNIAALLHFTVNGKDVTASHSCTASVTPTTPPTSTCKPGVPVGSPECLPPCQPGSSVPPESAQCQPPSLPNTGAGNTIAIFSAVAVAGFLVYRQILYRRHKAAFLAAEEGTSALPLGQPLDDEAPLAGTPLASKRKSLRRPRRF